MGEFYKMKVTKSEIASEKVIKYCTNNIFNGFYRYITCITLHKNDLESFLEYLYACEEVNQDYFFMNTEENAEQYKLYGCFTFRIPDIFNIQANQLDIISRNDNEIEDIISLWVNFCSCLYISKK